MATLVIEEAKRYTQGPRKGRKHRDVSGRDQKDKKHLEGGERRLLVQVEREGATK